MASTGFHEFVAEPPDELKCLICLAVARDPRQHEECGKLFCSECIEKYGKKKPCPNCKKTGAFYKDHNSRRRISELKVKCDNVERNCEWVGTISTLQEHLSTCKFALVPCPKQCKDLNNQIKCFFGKDLDEHLEKDCPNRDFTCDNCGEKSTYAKIPDHVKVCPKKLVSCPNPGCTDIMERRRVKEHVATECEYTRTPCKYSRLGCETELKRKDMAAHEEDDKLHLRMAIDTTLKLERYLADARITLKNGQPMEFQFTDYQKRKE